MISGDENIKVTKVDKNLSPDTKLESIRVLLFLILFVKNSEEHFCSNHVLQVYILVLLSFHPKRLLFTVCLIHLLLFVYQEKYEIKRESKI